MIEYPVFVPFDDEYLGAVVTVPLRPASGVVLFLTGTGAPRSHRFQLWTRAARRLADEGVASIRTDYLGIGDSTGTMLHPRQGDDRIHAGIAAARFAMEALGNDRLVVVGNCSGGVIGLGVTAEMQETVGLVSILPRLVQVRPINKAAMEARKSKLAAVLLRSRLLHALGRTVMTGSKGVPTPFIVKNFEPALTRARTLFVYSEQDLDPYVEKSRRLLGLMARRLPAQARAHLELAMTNSGRLSGFEELPVQEEILDLVTRWVVRCLANREPELPIAARGLESESRRRARA